MPWSRVFAASLVVAAVALLGGCAPGPSASPTPTPLYTSDEDALAAAEQVYRDYNDASNSISLAQPSTFEPVYALTTGTLNADLKERFSLWHADQWVRSGLAVIENVQPSDQPSTQLAVSLLVCLDVSEVSIVDSRGVSQIPPDRPEKMSLFVDLNRNQPDGKWKVENERGLAGESACSA